MVHCLYLFLSFITGKQYRVNLQFSFSRCLVFFCSSILNKHVMLWYVMFGKIITRTNCAIIKTLDQFCMLCTAFVFVYV